MRGCQEDKDIKVILNHEVEHLEVSPDLFNKIRKNIYDEEQKDMMKNKGFNLGRKKRVALIASLCLIVGSITAVAATSGGSWISRSHTAFDTFPTKQEVQKDGGYLPKYVESLPGGFEFTEASIGDGKMMDETGKVETKTKEISFMYDGAEKKEMPVFLNTILVDEEYITGEDKEIVANYKGLDLAYYNQTYKFVPGDYVPTAEDNQAMAAGELQVSYGSAEVEVDQVQSISWYEDGISYEVMGFDRNFKVDELVEMAKAVIDAE